ncbi:unnamed protein product, partial [Effrenium voratum]
ADASAPVPASSGQAALAEAESERPAESVPAHLVQIRAMYSPKAKVDGEDNDSLELGGSAVSPVPDPLASQAMTAAEELLQGQPEEWDEEALLKRELAKLRTGEDVIAFFAKNGSNSSVKFVYCKRREHVAAADFRPYDLEVISELMEGSSVATAAKLGEHFTISATGVVHVCPGQQSEHMSLGDWPGNMDAPVGLSVSARRKERGSESETREPDSDRLSQPSVDSQPGLQKLDEEAQLATADSLATLSDKGITPVTVDVSKLVDLPPAEQKRRGNELLSLLSEGDKAPTLPNLPPPPQMRKHEAFLDMGKAWTKKSAEPWEPSGPIAGDLRCIPAEQSSYQWDMSWDKSQMVLPQSYGSGFTECLSRELVPVLYEAAHRAFGPGHTANVQCLPDASGYEVFVQGAAAQEAELRGDALLEALGRALWPLLGDPYIDMNRHLDSAYGSNSYRLMLWRSGEGEAADSRRCWNYVRHGSCARGDACRWAHAMPETFGIGIKVSPVRYAK